MTTKTMTQIQVRIDAQTKNEAKKILDNIGLDISTAVKILFKQIVNTGTLPIELRDSNEFRTPKAAELRESLNDAKTNPKSFNNADDFLKDVLTQLPSPMFKLKYSSRFKKDLIFY